jgi:hypothetical protein
MFALGRGFAVQEPYSAVGRGFSWAPTFEFQRDYGAEATGQMFGVTPSIYGGGEANGHIFKAEPLISMVGAEGMYVTGTMFAVSFTGVMVPATNMAVTGRGFAVTPSLFGGGIGIGRAFKASLEANASASTAWYVTGRGFKVSLEATATAPVSMYVTGRGFVAALYYARGEGRGFAVTPYLRSEYTVEYAEAYVMNTLNNAVTRYQNFPFMHVARIGENNYGVRSDGLYLLTGTDDTLDNITLTPVNGTIVTKDTDFGAYQSKNVAYMYQDGEDDYRVTPIVDGTDMPTEPAEFGGRRTRLARGSKGRYWAFRVEGIHKLQGLEYLPDAITRRVK